MSRMSATIMKYISAQPETKYEWQIDTMIHSYLKQGVKSHDIIILLGDIGKYSFTKLREKYKGVNFNSYPYKSEPYAPSVKPYLMSKYFGSCSCTQGEQYYYADADTILTKPLPRFQTDKVYMSNTKSYIGYNYIVSKGEEILDIMCDAAKIDKNILRERQEDSGGAHVNLYFQEQIANSGKTYMSILMHFIELCETITLITWNCTKEHTLFKPGQLKCGLLYGSFGKKDIKQRFQKN